MSTNPFDEYIASMKTPTKCTKHITIRRVVHVIKKKPALSETEKKILMLKQQLEEMRSLLPLPVVYTTFQFMSPCGTPREPQFIYDKNSTEITIHETKPSKQTTHVDGSLLYFTEFNLVRCNTFQVYDYPLPVTQDNEQKQLENCINSFNNIKKIFIISDFNNAPALEYRMGDTSNGRAKLMVSERLVSSLSLFIQNNKNCEIHFKVGICNFMIQDICSKIKLRNVSKIVIYYSLDGNMYNTYMSRNPHIKMTPKEFSDSQMKIFMDTIKKKYHYKFHIISSMI